MCPFFVVEVCMLTCASVSLLLDFILFSYHFIVLWFGIVVCWVNVFLVEIHDEYFCILNF